MFDDDYVQRIFREMMERMFGELGPLPSSGRAYVEFRAMPAGGLNDARGIAGLGTSRYGPVLNVEVIDLDDRVLVVVEGLSGVEEPVVAVRGRVMVVKTPDGGEVVRVDLPHSIQAEGSSVTVRNGVLEASLIKADDDGSEGTEEWVVGREE